MSADAKPLIHQTMRRHLNLIILSVIAIVAIAASVIVSLDGGFDRLFGGRTFSAGDKLFEFDPTKVKTIEVTVRGNLATMEQREDGVWWGKAPWIDRMDPRAAAAIFQFSKGTEIVDILPKEEVDYGKMGLESEAVKVKLRDSGDEIVAGYRLGNRSPWIWKDEEAGRREQTVYAFTKLYDREDEAYVLTGNIRPLFDPEFRRLRDHRPYLFHRSQPQRLKLNFNGSEVLIERASPTAPWMITKPISLKTSPKRMRFLIEGLEKLTALRVDDRDALTLPKGDRQSISVQRFGEEHFTELQIIPPTEAGAKTALATVSDRPNAIFHLPLSRVEDLIGLNELPLKVNDLRYRNLIDLDRRSLRSITIKTAGSQEDILISRQEGQPYLFRTHDSAPQPLNEDQLADLFLVLGSSSVENFVSDAAIDLSKYQLDQPLVQIGLFYFGTDIPTTLNISKGPDGKYYATILGSGRVVEISENLFSRIATEPYKWSDKRLFNFPAMDIVKMTLTEARKPEDSITLHYDFLNNTWEATRAGQDVSAEINANIANRLFETVATMFAFNRLPQSHQASMLALRRPSFAVQVEYKKTDEFGDEIGRERTGFKMAAPIGAKSPLFYYGAIDGQGERFTLDMATTRQLAELYRGLIES